MACLRSPVSVIAIQCMAHVGRSRLRTVDKGKRGGGYFWPAITAILVITPLYTFRHEGSTLHVVLRVIWSVVLILSLIEISRTLYKDHRGRRVSETRPVGSRMPDGL